MVHFDIVSVVTFVMHLCSVLYIPVGAALEILMC